MKWLDGALLGALALLACGRGGGSKGPGSLGTRGPSQDPAPSIPPASAPGDCPNGVTVRITGTNQGEVSYVVLTPGIAGATCAFSPACGNTDVAQAPMDLSSDAVAHDLVTFNYPPAGYPPPGYPPGGSPQSRGLMTLLVEFVSGAARIAGGTASGLSVCGSSIYFTFDPSRIRRDRCSVTILLDVGRSVVPDAGGLSFIPQYRVFF